MLDFFRNGGVFLFDEDDAASEADFYRLEDLMGEEEGQHITEAYVGTDGETSVYYDGSVMSEEEARLKYENGEYKKYI